MRGGTRAQGAPGRKGLLAGEGGGAQQEHQFDGADGRRAGRRGGCMYPGCPREYATLHVATAIRSTGTLWLPSRVTVHGRPRGRPHSARPPGRTHGRTCRIPLRSTQWPYWYLVVLHRPYVQRYDYAAAEQPPLSIMPAGARQQAGPSLLSRTELFCHHFK
jgi:hypothetical protein